MLAVERRNKILAILQEEQKVIVSDLSKKFNVTEETIRRDLEKLESEGFAKKTYGGAILNENFNMDVPYTVRKMTNVDKKAILADIVAGIVEDGDSIMLDSSSTAVFIAKRLKHKKNLTIITNSIEMVLQLSDVDGWKIICAGGSLRQKNLSLVGHVTENIIAEYHVDKAIVSCKGIDLEKGFTDSNEADAYVKKAMLSSAYKRIVVADSTKFGKVAFTKFCDFSEVDMLISNEDPGEAWMKKLQASNIEVCFSN